MKLTFLHSNDIHGRLEGLARLTTIARQEQVRAEAEGRIVFRWDAGDAFDRRFEACRLTRGEALVPVLTASGVTVQTLGNDIGVAYGMRAVTRMAQRGAYSLLAANLRYEDGSLVDGLQDRLLLDLPGGLKLGVFGLTDPFGGIYGVYGLNTPPAAVLAEEIVNELRDAGADLIVLLSHLGLEHEGLDHDRHLARVVPGIDLILGGHTHDLLPEGEWVGHTLIAQAGEYAEHLGRVDLEYDPQERHWNATAQVLPIPTDTALDPQVLRALENLEKEVNHLRSEVLGTLVAPLPLDHFGESKVANFVAAALRHWANAEIGLISGGALHTPLEAGEVTRGVLANAVPAGINPMTSHVTGVRLVAALERGLNPDVVSYHHRGLRGTPMGVPGLSGVQVTVDPEKPIGQRVKAVQVNGEPLETERLYVVAHTDLEPASYAFLEGEGRTELNADFTVLLEDVVQAYIRKTSPVHPDLAPVWLEIEKITDLRRV